MLVSPSDFAALTGKPAPAEYEAVEALVVSRLSMLLNRDLEADFDADDLPASLAHAIAAGVASVAAPQRPQIPAGYQSMSVAGEYSVSVMAGVVPSADGTPLPVHLAHVADLGGRCVTMALRHRRVSL